MGRNPASNRRSKTLIWCGVNSGMECSQMWSSGTANRSCAAAQSTHWLRQLKTKQRAVVMQQLLSRGRIRFRRRALQLRENLTQRPNQLVARNMAPLELNPELERLILRLELKNKRLRPLRTRLLFAAFATRLIPCQAALQDPMQHLHHFLLGGLPRNLQQQRFRHDPLLDTLLAQHVRNIAQRKCLRHRGARPPNLPRDVLMGVLKLRREPMQPVRFFKRSQILSLNILDESALERLRIISGLLDPRDFAQSPRARRVLAPLASNDVVTIRPRNKSHQQRIPHALLAHRLSQVPQITDGLPRLIAIRPHLVLLDHQPAARYPLAY